MMNDQKRLHPIVIALRFLRLLRELLFPIIIFVFFGGNRSFGLYSLLGAGLVIVLLLIFSVLWWYRFSYRIEEDELRVEYGVLIQKKRYIHREKIQSINVSQGIVQRVFNLVKIQVETAGGGHEAEVVLAAITRTDASQLQTTLMNKANLTKDTGHQLPNENHIDDVTRFTLSTKDLLIAATTSGRIGVILSALAAFSSQIDEFIPEDFYMTAYEQFVHLGTIIITGLVIAFLIIAWLLSILGSVLKYGGFSIEKQGDDLIISQGILEKKQITIPVRKIQAVRIQESIIREPLGYVTVYVESAGSVSEKSEDFSTLLFPLLHRKKLKSFLTDLLPDYCEQVNIHTLPERSKFRYIFRLVLPAIVIFVPVAITIRPWGALTLAIIPILYSLAIAQYNAAGVGFSNTLYTSISRAISKTTYIVPKKKIQSLQKQQSKFQQRKQLSTVKISIMSKSSIGKQARVVDLDNTYVEEVLTWFSRK
ncbi:hypothetical protein EJF36_07335 [Bacillus sp. HMF5848]|uniref:PH domain-containing protein n=1 Tax=Bacillus sp. HMF5848 TaxID=2495421 RepID=UPI000F7B9739|nr:PH domain-containing protein [Bacillus sp. HMF5848]RSK26685.1 hypothetical protein EJF36_07335 [Bacillus sp. HMF5848]